MYVYIYVCMCVCPNRGGNFSTCSYFLSSEPLPNWEWHFTTTGSKCFDMSWHRVALRGPCGISRWKLGSMVSKGVRTHITNRRILGFLTVYTNILKHLSISIFPCHIHFSTKKSWSVDTRHHGRINEWIKSDINTGVSANTSRPDCIETDQNLAVFL